MAKAERAHSTSDPDSFDKSLFEPLPPEAEPVMSPDFKRETREAVHDRWLAAYRQMKTIIDLRNAHFWGERAFHGVERELIEAIGVDRTFWTKPAEYALLRMWDVARHRLIMTPAPTKEYLRYKKARATEFGKKVTPEEEAAIAADEARLVLPRGRRYDA